MFEATIVVHKRGMLAGEGTDSPSDIDRVTVKIPARMKAYAELLAQGEAERIESERGLPARVWEVRETND